MLWYCPETFYITALILHWSCCETTLWTLWNRSESTPSVMLWNCCENRSETALKLPWNCSGSTPWEMLWDCYENRSETALKLLWNCPETALVQLRQKCSEIIMKTALKPLWNRSGTRSGIAAKEALNRTRAKRFNQLTPTGGFFSDSLQRRNSCDKTEQLPKRSTHTHTHTHTERERDKLNDMKPKSALIESCPQQDRNQAQLSLGRYSERPHRYAN